MVFLCHDGLALGKFQVDELVGARGVRRAQEIVEHIILPTRELAAAEMLGHHGADIVSRALFQPEQGFLVRVAPAAQLVLELVEELVRRRRIAVAMAVHDAGLRVDRRDMQPPARPAARDGGDLLCFLVRERELFLEDAAVIRIGSGHEYGISDENYVQCTVRGHEYADRMMAHGAEFFLCQSVKGRSRLLDIRQGRAAALDVDGPVIALEVTQRIICQPLRLRQELGRMEAGPARADEQHEHHKNKFLQAKRLTSAASGKPHAQSNR